MVAKIVCTLLSNHVHLKIEGSRPVDSEIVLSIFELNASCSRYLGTSRYLGLSFLGDCCINSIPWNWHMVIHSNGYVRPHSNMA